MGGYSSGRYRTRNRASVEQALCLDIRRIRRDGFVRPGSLMAGVVTWSRGGNPTGSIGLTVDLRDPENSVAVLDFAADGEPQNQRIALMSKPCRYGGRRYYFWCPHSWRRCEVLCCVGGVFASRQFHRLTYASQSESPVDRAARAHWKAEARALGEGGHPRPRGANRERLIERWCDMSEQHDAHLAAYVMRRWGPFI